LVVDAPHMPTNEWSALWNAIDALPLAFVIDLVHYDTIANAAFRQIDATAVPFSVTKNRQRVAITRRPVHFSPKIKPYTTSPSRVTRCGTRSPWYNPAVKRVLYRSSRWDH
jgi:hypothetical protein